MNMNKVLSTIIEMVLAQVYLQQYYYKYAGKVSL